MIRRLTLCSPLPCPHIQWLRPAAFTFLGKGLYCTSPMPPPPLYLFGKRAVSALSHATPPLPLPFWEKGCICALLPPCVFAVSDAGVFYFCTFCLRRDGIRSGRDRISFTTANSAARQCARTKKYAAAPVIGRRSAFACIMRLQFSVFRRAA